MVFASQPWMFELWIVYVGMLVAIVQAVNEVRGYRLTDHLHWHLVVKTSIHISAVIILWFFAFELY